MSITINIPTPDTAAMKRRALVLVDMLELPAVAHRARCVTIVSRDYLSRGLAAASSFVSTKTDPPVAREAPKVIVCLDSASASLASFLKSKLS